MSIDGTEWDWTGRDGGGVKIRWSWMGGKMSSKVPQCGQGVIFKCYVIGEGNFEKTQFDPLPPAIRHKSLVISRICRD